MNAPVPQRRSTYAQREAAQAQHRADFPDPPVSRFRGTARRLPPPTPAEVDGDALLEEGRTTKEHARLRLALAALRVRSPLNTAALRVAMGLGGNRTDLAGAMLRKWHAEGLVRRICGGRESSRNGGAHWALVEAQCSLPS